jgi:nucleotide-binding universal stress UspA family protein
MTYRSMLVPLDEKPGNAARVDIAIGMAKTFDAHLIGLAVIAAVETQGLQAAAALYDYVSRDSQDAMAQALTTAHHFHTRCEAAGLPSFEAATDKLPAPQSLADHARCADLLILSQPNPGSADHRQQLADLEQVLLDCPRPMLLLPYTRSEPVSMRRVLLAWDGSRQSTRAMTDALPMLRRADQVTLVHCCGPNDERHAPSRSACVRQWLAFQGVDAELRDEVTTLPIGDALLNFASGMGADLIVMGAYGHPRWTEKLFGGVSQTVLCSSTVPVLMSH